MVCLLSVGWEIIGHAGFDFGPNFPDQLALSKYWVSMSMGEQRDLSFARGSSWIKNCFENHPHCALQSHHLGNYIPTRVIDIGSFTSPRSPRLLVPNGSVIVDSRYIALSHSWGCNMPSSAKTLSGTFESHLKRICEASLPLSFRDAFDFARILGVNYVWIDSLCIIQDSTSDWEQESAKMSRVYAESWCTLSISYKNETHSTFHEPDVLQILRGMSGQTEMNYDIPQKTRMLLMKLWLDEVMFQSPDWEDKAREELQKRVEWIDSLNSIPLNERGWTLQERELSPRVFHYTPKTVLWECRSLRATDTNPQGFSDHGSLDQGFLGELTKISRYRLLDTYPINREPAPVGLSLASGLHRIFASKRDDAIYDSWFRVVEDYSQRDLTFPNDRFPAISGLAQEVEALTGDRYLAGLWEKDFLRGLVWKTVPDNRSATFGPEFLLSAQNLLDIIHPTPKPTYAAPSWSWASSIKPVSYGLLVLNINPPSIPEGDDLLLNIVDVNIQALGPDPRGCLSNGGYIIVTGKIKPKRHFTETPVSDKGANYGMEVHFDSDLDRSRDDLMVLPVLIADHMIPWVTGLLLQPSGDTAKEYRRVGVVGFMRKSYFTDAEDVTIKIV